MTLLSDHVEDFLPPSGTMPEYCWSNGAYSRLIDGRTVHQYLQFIEPDLDKAVRIAASSDHQLPNIPRVSAAHGAALTRFQRGLRALAAVGLDYFVALLAIDEVLNGSETRYESFSRRLYLSANTDETVACDVLSAAAEEFLLRVLDVEASISASSMPKNSKHEFCRTFKVSVMMEYDRRTGQRRSYDIFSPQSLLAMMNSIDHYYLSCEILAYWYPLWAREKFIFSSPFDTAPDASSLYRSLEACRAGEC